MRRTRSAGARPIGVVALSVIAAVWLATGVEAQQRMLGGGAGTQRTVVAPMPAGIADRAGAGYPVGVDISQLAGAARDGGTVTVTLTDTLTVTAAVDWAEALDGHLFVAGRLLAGDGEVTLTAMGDTLAGRVVADGRLFTIARDSDSSVHRVTEVDERALPPEAPPLEVAGIEPRDAAIAGDTNEFVDLLVVYTPAARAAAGGTSQIVALLNGAKDNANLALANAHVTHRFRVTHAEEVTYTETNNMQTTLARLRTAGDGFLDGVQGLRELYRADVVTILTTDNDACGLGYLMGPSSVNSGFEPYAYNVVLWSCANGNLSMAHEIGHNMGLHHDRANAGGSSPAFDYAYGYAVSGLARDVMAYACASNCPRLAIFSTPLYNFPSTGTLAGTATEDNARALDNTSLVVANFRQACSFSLTASSASFAESGGGGSVGLTATAGCAWTATSNDGFLAVSPATASGSGSLTINFTVAADVGAVNVTTSARAGSPTIARRDLLGHADGLQLRHLAKRRSVRFSRREWHGQRDDAGLVCLVRHQPAGLGHDLVRRQRHGLWELGLRGGCQWWNRQERHRQSREPRFELHVYAVRRRHQSKGDDRGHAQPVHHSRQHVDQSLGLRCRGKPIVLRGGRDRAR